MCEAALEPIEGVKVSPPAVSNSMSTMSADHKV
jgi:hypothetical protein